MTRGIVAVVDGTSSTTNPVLVEEWRRDGIDARITTPDEALVLLRPGDIALLRIDIRATLDGLEPGLLTALALMRRGVRVLNRPRALLTAHDKLRTSKALARVGLPQPWTLHLRPGEPPPAVGLPVVVKPRFGSWGADVHLCETQPELEAALGALRGRSWFARQGALLQELVPPVGHDLRLLVASGRIVGAIRRRARPGEWRTNHSLGGTLEPVVPPRDARALAVAAAEAVGGDLVGVDLLPAPDGYRVVEVNGAVDFEPSYALAGVDVYRAVAQALGLRSTTGGNRGGPRPACVPA